VTTTTDLTKKHAVVRLDREAVEHASGHQNVHARRYLLPRPGRPGLEVLTIIKGHTCNSGARREHWIEVRVQHLAGHFDLAARRTPRETPKATCFTVDTRP
jgi:hypothetical protein